MTHPHPAAIADALADPTGTARLAAAIEHVTGLPPRRVVAGPTLRHDRRWYLDLTVVLNSEEAALIHDAMPQPRNLQTST